MYCFEIVHSSAASGLFGSTKVGNQLYTLQKSHHIYKNQCKKYFLATKKRKHREISNLDENDHENLDKHDRDEVPNLNNDDIAYTA